MCVFRRLLFLIVHNKGYRLRDCKHYGQPLRRLTRVVTLVTEGIFSTAVMTLAVFPFDRRVGLLMSQDGIYRRFISGREKAVGWKL